MRKIATYARALHLLAWLVLSIAAFAGSPEESQQKSRPILGEDSSIPLSQAMGQQKPEGLRLSDVMQEKAPPDHIESDAPNDNRVWEPVPPPAWSQEKSGHTILDDIRRRAEQGNADDQRYVGLAYGYGSFGLPKDQREAAKWYRRAAEQGNTSAMFFLAIQYMYGEGVPQDYVSAHFWFNLAATYAEETHLRTSAAEERQGVADRMTGQQIARAQELASRWRLKKEASPDDGWGDVPKSSAPGDQSDTASTVTGTGFYVSQGGHVLTNAHVVERCRKVRLRDPDGTLREASVTGRDARNDLALLKSVSTAPAVASFTGRRLRLGQLIVVYGFPLSGLLTSAGNLTTGSVTGLAGLGEDVRLVQISAPIQLGNSGGPVLDAEGNVLAVVVSKLDAIAVANATEDIPQNINFAIKGNVAMNFLESRGVDFVKSSAENALTPEAIGARAMRFTVRVECLR